LTAQHDITWLHNPEDLDFKGDTSMPLLLNFSLQYTITKFLENQEGPEMNGTCQFLVCAGNVKHWTKTQTP
jgi:hypothetical protein